MKISEVLWLEVWVDEDGYMIIRDRVGGIQSPKIQTVNFPPEHWVEDIVNELINLLNLAGTVGADGGPVKRQV